MGIVDWVRGQLQHPRSQQTRGWALRLMWHRFVYMFALVPLVALYAAWDEGGLTRVDLIGFLVVAAIFWPITVWIAHRKGSWPFK